MAVLSGGAAGRSQDVSSPNAIMAKVRIPAICVMGYLPFDGPCPAASTVGMAAKFVQTTFRDMNFSDRSVSLCDRLG